MLQSDPQLWVRNKDGEYEAIERVEIDTGKRTVGVRIAPDGSMDDEQEYLQEQINEWAEKIRTSNIPRDLVWTAMNTGILRKLAYSLPASTFTKKQCEDLMWLVIQIGLPKSSMHRRFPRAILYASHTVGGVGLPHPYVEQGVQQLKRLVEYGVLDANIMGHLLQTTLEWLAVELGCTGCPLQQDFKVFGMLSRRDMDQKSVGIS